MERLKEKTLKGFAWSGFGQGGNELLRFALMILLARSLSPENFGLMTMLTVFTGFALLMSELGLGGALIQYRGVSEEHLSSVFWVNLGVGSAFSLLFYLFAEPLAAFYEQPDLASYARALAVLYVIGSLFIVHQAYLRRNMDFRILSAADLISVAVSGAVAIGMAWAGYGVWSLVTQKLLEFALRALLLWRWTNWRPRLQFSLKAISDLWSFGINLAGTQALNYFVRQFGNLIVGKYLGASALGLFSRAYVIMMLPTINVTSVLAKVMFPSLAAIQGQRERTAAIYLKVATVIAMVVFPVMCFMTVMTKDVVLLLLGEKWLDVVPILQVLAPAGMIQSIIALNGSLFLSQGRADLQFRIGLVLKLNALLCMLIGLQWGVIGVAWGIAFASVVNSVPSMHFSLGLVGLKVPDVWGRLSKVILASVVMLLALALANDMLPDDWSAFGRLAMMFPIAAAIYWTALQLLREPAYQEVLALLKQHLARNP